jgi:hypothetical protein
MQEEKTWKNYKQLLDTEWDLHLNQKGLPIAKQEWLYL